MDCNSVRSTIMFKASLIPIRSGVAKGFPQWLDALITAHFKSRRAFVRIAEPHRKEDTAQSYVTQVIKGATPPPLGERLAAWAQALPLTAAEREQFIRWAALEHIPDAQLRIRLRNQLDQVTQLRQDYERLLAAAKAKELA